MDTLEEPVKLEKLWNSNYVKVWVANFMIFFSFMLLTPLLPLYLKDTFGADKQAIGIVLSGYTLFALLIRPFSGFFVDSFPRKVVLLICYGLFCVFFGGYLAAGSLLLFAIVRTLHGAPFGATTVANSTVAIDVLHPSRRAEGIGYYGLSNNIASAIAPALAIYILHLTNSYELLFWISLLTSAVGFAINATLKLNTRELVKDKPKISLDRFFLLKGWSEALTMVCFAFSYGVLATYVAIYGKEELGISGGSALFFMLLSIGLILSRLVGSRTLRQGKITQNAAVGVSISVFGYLLFAALHNPIGYYGAALVIGLGNGHMWPAYQTMFINLAPHTQRGTANSSVLISWDVGVGLGILVGGVLSEHVGYHLAFWAAWILNVVGVVGFFAYVRQSYLRNRLR
ncbi:MAG: MFS transporter [Bacteroidales bacterium]|nr:MFS transporter [Bacteroidales bacterium]